MCSVAFINCTFDCNAWNKDKLEVENPSGKKEEEEEEKEPGLYFNI